MRKGYVHSVDSHILALTLYDSERKRAKFVKVLSTACCRFQLQHSVSQSPSSVVSEQANLIVLTEAAGTGSK